MKYKSLFTILAVSCISLGYAQVPSGYYDNAQGLTGYPLKTALHNIINNHNDQGYNAMDAFIANYDLDNYYETSSNTILDPYSENPSGADPYTFTPTTDECGNYNSEGDCYNKEHVIPQSVFNSNPPMHSDAHQLLPTDGRVNGFRSNYPFGVVDDNNLASQSGISNPTQNGSKLGGNLNSGYSAGYTGTVFEPIDEFKGDIARIYFYFVTRYESQMNSWGSYEMFDGSNDKAIADPFLNILLTWHQNDPVSQKEIDRNNNIYNHQNNRNPFVDNPSYVQMIWSTSTDTTPPTAPSNLVAANPTPSTVDLSWDASTDNVGIDSYEVFVDGSFYENTTTPTTSYTVTGLASETNFCFSVYALDAAGNMSPVSNQDCATTTASSTTVMELFFSEYMEGSGTNKAIEIANFTGNTVSLANYTLKLATNGNSFSTEVNFPTGASIASEDVYVIANSGLNTNCQAEQDYVNNDATGFNGNDAIGLFKDGVLIDIIGEEGDSATFAEGTTLVRKPTVTNPTTSFDLAEWDSFPEDNCDDLGQHQVTGLSIATPAKNNLKLYPNPVKGGLLHTNVTEKATYQVYDMLGKKVLVGNLDATNQTITVDTLQTGIYILKLETPSGSITKKLIKE